MKRAKGSTATTLDILNEVLGSVDDPEKICTYLTDELKEKTGSSCVLFIKYSGDSKKKQYNILSINPLQKRKWAESVDAERFYDLVYSLSSSHIFREGESSEESIILKHGGFGLSLAVPLNIGALRAGAMFILGLPDEKHLSSVSDTLIMSAAAAALVLNNEQFKERIEQCPKKIELDLKEAQRIAQIGSWSWDIKTNTLSWSEELYRIFGLDPSLPLPDYDGLSKLYTADTWALHNKVVKRTIETGEPYEEEFEFIQSDGSHGWLIARGEAIYDSEGITTGMQGTAQNITERKIAEGKLRQSEEKYRLIVETANEGIWLIDKDSKTSFVNDRMAEMLGYKKEEMAGKSLFDFVDEGGKNIAEKAVERRKLGMKEDHDFKFLRKDGNVIWAALKTSPVLDDNNNYAGALAMVTDITDTRQAEEVLMETKSRLQALIHEIPDMVIFKDLNCTHLVVNKAVEEFTGLTHDEIVGKTNEEILPPDIAKTCRQADEDAMRSSEPIRYEENTMSNSGKKVILDTIKAPIHDAQGKVMGLVMISRDITDRKLAEQEIRILNTKLEQRVIERTAQLDAANKELEAFSYSVSHDLRAPLRSIDGFTQALAEDYQDRLDDTGRDYINRVRQGVKKMTDLIDALLGLSRMTRGELMREPVDLSAIVSNISDDLKAKEPQRKVEFIIQDGVIANGDAQMLKIVLDNLMSNAWKFTGRHPSARIEFGEKVSDGNTEYFVRDDGAGFDEAYYDKLFSAFARLHTEAEFPGIGIGLATVRRIVNRHGGKVRAEGEVEKGATFYFSLK